jgi:predicted metal-dependent phosphoesterase TrpH
VTGNGAGALNTVAVPMKQTPLLCELHAHTTWSDGELTMRELCDLYGRAGFDVLAVTDHALPAGGVQPDGFATYLAAIEAENERALRTYDMLVLPGLELTFDDPDPCFAGHALAVGLRSYVDLGPGLEHALRAARAQGAALVAAHPYPPGEAAAALRGTGAFAAEPARWAPLVDRFELFNRTTLFSWVADAGLPAVANGDFHEPEHLAGWKTLLPCWKHERAVVEYLRSTRPAYLVRLEPEAAGLRRVA